MNAYDEKLKQEKLLPLYTATDLSLLPKAEEILLNCGLSFIEVTYRSALAGQAIKKLSESGRLIVGAGTVKDLDTAKDAIANGATFIVMPGFDEEVVAYCLAHDIAVYPGAVTPTEIMKAQSMGLDTVKFFPANVYGGLAAIKSLHGPFFEMSFIPTGGVNQENYLEFLDFEAVTAVGGSFIISEKMIQKDGGKIAEEQLKALVEKL